MLNILHLGMYVQPNIQASVQASVKQSKKDDEEVVGTCMANDGYGRQCKNKRMPNNLYCQNCWGETRPLGLKLQE